MEQWLVVLIFDNWSEHTNIGWNVWCLKLSIESTGKRKGMIVRGS